jgi:glycosyltransferase involved in cell wall biosynthesis
VAGEARQVVEAASAGVYVPSGNVPALVEAVRYLANRREELNEMGRRGREFVLEHYDRRMLAQRYIEILNGVIGQALTPSWEKRRVPVSDAS